LDLIILDFCYSYSSGLDRLFYTQVKPAGPEAFHLSFDGD